MNRPPRIVIGDVVAETDTLVTITVGGAQITALKGTDERPVVLVVDGTAVRL